MYSDFGIDVKVIASGGMKGAGTDGAPVTDDQVEYFQSIVDDLTDHFVTGVAQGRKMSPKQAKELADGRVHIGQKAKSAGLVDRIGRKEEARSALKQEIHHMANSQPGADPKLPPTTVKAQDDAAAVKAAADAKAEADAKIKADAEAKAKADLASQSEAVKQKNAYDISNCDAFNDHPQFAREQIRAGHSLEQAMKEFTAMLATENRELRESGPQANRSHVESPSNGGAGYKPRNSASAVTQTGSQSAQTKFRALRDSIRAENPRMTLQQATLKASDRDPTLHAAYLEEAQARSEEVRKARAAYDSARAR
jgi:hypothetical protein